MPILTHDEILQIHQSVISAQLVGSRSTLLGGIDGHFVAGLPYAANPSDQILEDLNAMNTAGTLVDGSVPLATWLQTAVARAGAKTEAAVFRSALGRCGGATASEPSAAQSGSAPMPQGQGISPAVESTARQPSAGSTYNVNITGTTLGALAVGDGAKAAGSVHGGTGASSSKETDADELRRARLRAETAVLPFIFQHGLGFTPGENMPVIGCVVENHGEKPFRITEARATWRFTGETTDHAAETQIFQHRITPGEKATVNAILPMNLTERAEFDARLKRDPHRSPVEADVTVFCQNAAGYNGEDRKTVRWPVAPRPAPSGTQISPRGSTARPAAFSASSMATPSAAERYPKTLQSTFISYGGPDTDFAQKLNEALLKSGVTTFFFAKDAIPGQKLHRLMREGVNRHDRVILVCSKASLARPGVLNEITETLQREARDGGKEYLIPITLDDYVFGAWKPEDPGVAQAILDRVVADFRDAETDQAKFDAGVLKLIAALKK